MDLSSDPFELPYLLPLSQLPNPLTSDIIIVDVSNISTSNNSTIGAQQLPLNSEALFNNYPFSKGLSASSHCPISYNRKRAPPGLSTDHSYRNKEPRTSQPQSSAREAIL